MNFQLNMPVRLYVGENAVQNHPAEFARYGKKCMIVTGAASAKKSGALDDVTAVLTAQGVAYQVFDEIGQNPLLSVCYRGGQAAIDFGADFLVGIGGGSPLDATKAIAVFAANQSFSPMDLYDGKNHGALPFLLVGTTAGTGSEITKYSVITVDETGGKRSWNCDNSFAQAAFGDARYTVSLSRDFTLSTGLDAVAHALEGYYSKSADALSDLFALEAMKLLLPALKEVWMDGNLADLDLRNRLYTGSIYAGMTLGSTGTAFCHLMSYYLTEEAGIAHGYACAVFLPDLLDYSVPLMPGKSRKLFQAIGMYAADLADTIQMMTTAEYAPIDDQKLETLLRRWGGTTNIARTPGDFNAEIQREIAEKILQKKP